MGALIRRKTIPLLRVHLVMIVTLLLIMLGWLLFYAADTAYNNNLT